MQISFTAPQDVIVSNTRFTYNESWAPAELPWFRFSKPFFEFEIINADTINSGAVGGIIDSADITLAIELPMKDGKWKLSGELGSPYPSISRFYQMAGGVNLTQALPSPFNALSGFGLKNTQLVYDSVNNAIEYVGFTFATDQTYKLLNNLYLEEITANVNVQNPGSVQDRFTTWSVNGTFRIGEGKDAGIVALGVIGPDLVFNGSLQSGVIKPTDLFSIFLPGVQFNPPAQPVVTDFQFTYAMQKINYTVECRLNIDWPISMLNTTVFTIKDVGVSVSGQGSQLIGGIDGNLILLPDDPNVNITLHLQASYTSATSSWLFEGEQTDGVLSISGLLKEYLGWDTGMMMGINGLKVSVSTDTNYWSFAGKTAEPWVIDFLNLTISGNALIGYGKRIATSTVGKYGSLLANINWLGIDMVVFYDFDPNYASYGIRWGLLEGKVVKDPKTGHNIATLSFKESASIGSIVETFVSWATGTKFGLAAPWSVLNSVPLNNLSLIYDFTDKKVSFNIGIGPIELGFVTIKGFSLSYNTADPDPEKNGVIVTLDVTSAWGDVPSWNAAKPETTPAPPGQGNKYLDLRLLAMGQHVTLDCFKTADNVQAAIACMSNLPDPKPGEIPPVHFDANSSWLTGMDFGVLRLGGDDKKANALVTAADVAQYFLTLQIVFNDPYLYALRIALEGEPAKIFKGLDFQIMYKKISDSIGLYQAEIVLPDVMRKINMGQFNITLPVFGIAIYTNGNFQVDIGFPWKEDFSRSFTFQTLIWTPIGIPIPVMGSAGVYFGHLSSATTNRVPAATNGTFNPVLVFGFGLQFGFGYSFDAGILKAGFSLTAVAILEGILAKWNPYQITDGSGNNTQLETSYYFWFRGTVGIIGKLYGSVDFAIVKAEVNIDIRLLAQLTFAPYEPIEISLTASVSVSLRVTINLGLFKIHISFNFSARIQQSITINAIGGTPPWKTDHTALYAAGIPMLKRRSRRLYYDQKELMAVSTALNPQWSNLEKAASPVPLTAYAGLGLTMAGDNAQQVSGQLACYIAMLFIESVPPPQDDRNNGNLKAYSNGADTSFEILSKEVFRWAIASIQSGPVTSEQVDALIITDLQIAALLDYLDHSPDSTPIPAAAVTAFLANQFTLTVNAPASGEANATYFPVPPEMVLTLPDYGTDYKGISYNFADYNSTSAAYTEYLRAYFNELAVQVEQQKNNLKAFSLDDSGGQSMASFIFSDYFLLLCKQMLQAARESLKDFKYYLQDGQSVNDIVNWVNQKAGTDLYSVEALFTDNVSAGLNSDKKLRITGSTYIVQASDTFDSIAAQAIFFNGFTGKDLATANQDTANTLAPGITINYPGKDPYKTLSGQSLTQVAQAIGVSVSDLINNGNITGLAALLLPVATLAIPSFSTTTGAGDTLNRIASKYNITQQQLSAPAENGTVTDLFDKLLTAYLNIANLQQFQAGELLKEIQATNGLQHLSGMTSRYYMAGLRLPTNGITPAYKGMWVTGSGSALTLPPYAGLYALTGQQFPIPTLTATDNFNIVFSKSSGINWLSFAGSDPAQLTIPLVPGSYDAKQISAVETYALNNSLDIALSTLGAQDAFITKAATYPFTSEISWNSASAFTMPYGGNAGGVPALSLWQLPDTLLQLPDLQTRKINPRMKMQIGRYDESSRSMINTPVTYYGYGSLVVFTIKRVPVVTESPATLTTYEIMGTDGNNTAILEKMVSGIGDNASLIATLTVAYSVDTNSTTSEGIQTDALNSLTMGIAQVNLSTETRPDTAAMAFFKTDAVQEEMVLLNDAPQFIRLLWQASITRGGGYYLYYFNSGNNSGLPDRIFNDNNEATLSLLVLYTAPQDDAIRNNITTYMNVLATGEAIDTTHSVLFAEADPYLRTLAADNTQTLAALAYGYYGNVADVAADNAKRLLRTGISLLISEGVYEVRPEGRAPGGKLDTIAAYFGTTTDKIKAANPLQISWPDPLPLYTSIKLPEITVIVGTSAGGNTLQDLAAYYGEDLTALAAKNLAVAGIFADKELLVIKGGPDIRTSTVPPGVAGIAAERAVPPEIPDDPSATDYGRIFLLNTYNMLSYQVAENNYFAASNLGLPASPSGETDDVSSNDKVSYPKTLAAGDNWKYTQSVPYSRFAKNTIQTKANMPDQAMSPYRGLGGLLQVDFAWQDLYGNRLITTLSNPSGNSQLNMPPMLTGYTDPIIGLNQWPSVASSWEVNTDTSNSPQLQLNLSFGDSYYQGLLWAKAAGTNSITAWFTEPLEEISAKDPANYSIDQGIHINSITLSIDKQTITLQVDKVPENLLITLNINNISNAGKTETYTGMAQFSSPEMPEETTSTIIEQAKKDLQVYQQLWYQLTDPNGIAYSVDTTLVKNRYTLSAGQVSGLVTDWIVSIYLFLENRSKGLTDVPPPVAAHLLTFTIDKVQLNEAQIFRLECNFTITRTRNAAAGDLETTGGILQAITEVSPLSGTEGGDTHSLNTFAAHFEAALLQPGKYAMRIATGNDREAAGNSKETWAVRLGLDKNALTPISYNITDVAAPDIFAPRPISNQLETRQQVPLYYYSEKNGINFDTPSAYVDFTGIDMDQWGQQFFNSIDNVLSPEFTAAMQLVDKKKNTAYLKELLGSKESLADIVKEWMIPVFSGEAADAAAVKEAFKQQLLEKLTNAYTTQAAVQFHATVSADAAAGIAPRLYGSISRNFKFTAAMVYAADKTIVYLLFTNPPDPAAAVISNFTASGGLSITNAGIDPHDTRRVILNLNGEAIAGSTQITVGKGFKDMTGNIIMPPLMQTALAAVNEGNNSDVISFTSPKLGLQKDTVAPLPFLISSPQIVRSSSNELLPYVDLNLSFAGSQIEHQISTLPNIEGYEASTWLSFVTPLDNTSPLTEDLGKIQVPMVLRAFPTAPSMVNQSGESTVPPNASNINQLLNWNYNIVYSLQIHYPQDQLDFTINFNVSDNSHAMLMKGIEDAFPELAEFITVSPSVYKILQTQLTKVTAGTADTDPLLDTVSTALTSYTALVSNVVKASQDNNMAMARRNNRLVSTQVLPYTFYIQEGSATVNEVQALIISIHGLPPDGVGQPLVNIEGYERQVYDQGGIGDFCYFYTQNGVVLPASAGQTIPERTVVIPAMNILARQDAATTTLIKRNAELVPGKPSSEPFIYTTGTVEFSNPYHPTTDCVTPVDISVINAPSGQHNYVSLTTQLTNLFDALLEENSQDTLSFLMSCQYNYQLNSGIEEVILPVMMQPMQSIQVKPDSVTGNKKLAEMIGDWADSIELWYNTVTPDTTNAVLWFDLTIFSSLTQQPLPLVRLRSLNLGIQYITNL
jgi:LysM repeat protein